MKKIEHINEVSYKEIGVMIKNKRDALDLSQQEVADYVGVSKSAVSRWESGELENIGNSKIKLLSEILKISALSIVKGVDEADESNLAKEEPSAGELMKYFTENKEKLSMLSKEEKDKLIKLIDLYLN